MRLLILGPPGVGKGTQAKRVSVELGVPHIATGDILREAVRNGTETGKKAKAFMDSGALVPDAVVIGVFAERVAQADCRAGFLLDGFPRTLEQCTALDGCLTDLRAGLDSAINLTAPRAAIVERLEGRRLCRGCDASYHMKYLPPKRAGVCDRCGGQLYQRDDDHAATIVNRLDVYEKQTAPVIDFYRSKKVLKDVSSEGDVNAVFNGILAALGRAAK
ncbi:MAG: adenylate kinase [Planctomycetes bacterium]|nr:adenylate kinase [Planctomycetota bacterium]